MNLVANPGVVERAHLYLGTAGVVTTGIITYALGRVEKSKNGINSYGYCFLVAFWYVETRKNIFFGQRKFFVGWNLT